MVLYPEGGDLPCSGNYVDDSIEQHGFQHILAGKFGNGGRRQTEGIQS